MAAIQPSITTGQATTVQSGGAPTPTQTTSTTAADGPKDVYVGTTVQQAPIEQWLANSQQAFEARDHHDVDGFLKTLNADGVDVRGLNSQTDMDTRHLSHDDIKHDFDSKGPLFNQIFNPADQQHHDALKFTPDPQGKIAGILLN